MRYALITVGFLAGCGSLDVPSGTWNTTSQTFVESTCLADGQTIADLDVNPTPFLLDVNDEDDTFTLDLSSGGDTVIIECARDGNSWNCPALTYEVEFSADPPGKMVITVAMDGEFTSETTMAGNQHIKTDCEGESCVDIEDYLGYALPCDSDLTFEAEFAE